MLDEPQSRYPHPSNEENEKINESGISLFRDLWLSIFPASYEAIKSLSLFFVALLSLGLLNVMYGLWSVLDSIRDFFLSLIYYCKLNSNDRRLVNLILKNKSFYSSKNNEVFIFNQCLSIEINDKFDEKVYHYEHHQYMDIQNLENKNFMNYHVDHILTFVLKLKCGRIISNYRYDIKITSNIPYQSFKNNVLKTEHILNNL